MKHTFIFYRHAGTDNHAAPMKLIRDLAYAGKVNTREAILVQTDDDQAAELIRMHASPESILVATTQAVDA